MTAEVRDGRGKALTDYPRPSVAVATAVLTYDPDRLPGKTFTLRQLRQVHEAVDGAETGPDKLDTFRRRMQEKLIRVTAGPVRPEGRGRPAQLFRRC